MTAREAAALADYYRRQAATPTRFYGEGEGE